MLRGSALLASVLALVIGAVACAGGDPSWPVTAARAAPPSGTLSAGPGGLVLTVATGSKAVVRVREQLAILTSPSDAVLTSDAVTGRVAVRRDGTFVAGSKITVALDDLRSDNGQRDRYVKEQTLQTRLHPFAEFVPSRATGLSLPLRTDGEVTFKLTGTLTLHGVSKEVSFNVTASRTPRAPREVNVIARNDPAWKFADFGLEIPRVFSVLSVVDELRLEVQLIATEGQGT